MSTVSRRPRQPSYRHHKASGQAVVTLGGRDVYLGKYGTHESKQAYKRLVLEWLVNDGECYPPPSHQLTVSELTSAYKSFAKRHYVRDGEPTETYRNVRFVMRALGESPYGPTPAVEFGPLALKAYRHQMIAAGNSRRYLNDQIATIKRAFKWAVSEELIPKTTFRALQTVEGLKSGRTEAKDNAPIQPVSDELIEATVPHLPPVVDDMIRLLRLLGCRPGELCVLRPRNVERAETVWTYRPERHKTQHKGRSRVIFIGPKAQAILAPYLLRGPDEFCFSPAESDRRRREKLHAERKTPITCGNKPGSNCVRSPKRVPGSRYTHTTINRAVQRGCDKADVAAHAANQSVPPEARLVARWFTYQLRHSAATEFRKKFGLEAAQVLLGHSKADVTQIYAERDNAKAVAVMAEVG